MDCSKVTELLSDYIDGMIDEEDKDIVERHLSECEKCRQEYEILNRIMAGCRRLLDEIDLPENFEMDLHNRLTSEKQSKREGWTSFIYKYRGAAAGFLALAVSIGMLTSLGIFGRGMHKKSESTAQNAASGKAAVANEAKDRKGYQDALTYGAEAPKGPASTAGVPDQTEKSATTVQDTNNYTLKSKADDASPETGQDNGGRSIENTLTAATANTDSQAPQPDGNKKMAMTAPKGPSYDMISVTLNEDEYKKNFNNIENDIKSMEGNLKSKEPLQYSIPVKYKDQFINKLTGEYKIQGIVVNNISLADNYEKLKEQEAEIEAKQKSNTTADSTEALNAELGKIIDQIKNIDEMKDSAIIQIDKK